MEIIICKNCGRFNRKRQKCSITHGCFNFGKWRPSPKFLNKIKVLETQLGRYKKALNTLADWPFRCPPEEETGNCFSGSMVDDDQCLKHRLYWVLNKVDKEPLT